MSICIAYRDMDSGKIICGSDSIFLSSEYSIGEVKESKVFEKGGIIYLSSGNTHDKHLLKYGFTLDGCFFLQDHTQEEIERYLNTEYMDAFKRFAIDNGMVDSNNRLNNSFILIVNGRLYNMYSDFTLVESDKNYLCSGCGSDIAYGALYALEGDNSKSIKEKIVIAINACSEFSSGCDNRVQLFEF